MMQDIGEALLAVHQANTTLSSDAASMAGLPCEGDPVDNKYWGLRIGSIFIILAGGGIGALLPIAVRRLNIPPWFFFITNYVGSGVILATAWMHLLAPAVEALDDVCVRAVMPHYGWAMGIALTTVMLMFLIELILSNFDFGIGHGHGHSHGAALHLGKEGAQVKQAELMSAGPGGFPMTHEIARSHDVETASSATSRQGVSSGTDTEKDGHQGKEADRIPVRPDGMTYPPGNEDHLVHRWEHAKGDSRTGCAQELTAIFILEFGVIFHSIFIGLTLAVTNNFLVLLGVLFIHQTFEGLGMGARLAVFRWPSGVRAWTPHALAIIYAVSTPMSIAVGLGVNQSLRMNAVGSRIVMGVFDAISGGILMYVGLVELLAHEFMFSPDMRKAGLRIQLMAYVCVAAGAAVMAVLAIWA